jgi:antitoxin component YwqK of YwqJK toxin-antitoxin module
MSKFYLLSIFLFFLALQSNTQTTIHSGNRNINQTDSQGRKQGMWEKKYPNGNFQYKGLFKNDRPVGEMTRYYEDGTKQAVMHFDEEGIHCRAVLYYDNGEIAAKGNYIQTRKDSVWEYYSYYSKNLIATESFRKGVKDGLSVVYFESGRPSQELEWQNDLKHGTWKQFFENGKIKLQGYYINNKKHGPFTYFFLNGLVDLKGRYVDDNMEGPWEFYDEKGKLITKIEYKNGRPENEEEMIREQQELFKLIESRKGKIPEPDETNRQF